MGLLVHSKLWLVMLHWSVAGRAKPVLAPFGSTTPHIGAGSLKYWRISLALAAALFLIGVFENTVLRGGMRLPVSGYSGFALAALLILGGHFWPAILAGLLAAYMTVGGLSGDAIVAAGVSVLAASLGAELIKKFAGGASFLTRARHFVRFAGIVAAATALAPLSMLMRASGQQSLRLAWFTAWQAELLGLLLIAPVAAAWVSGKPQRQLRRSMTIALCVALAACVLAIFSNLVPFPATLALGALCMVLSAAAPARLSQRELTAGVLLLAAVAVAATLRGHGPFAGSAMPEPLLALQMCLGVYSIIILGISALVSEHRRAEDFLRKSRDELAAAAISDPLTGLANYRHFIDVFNAEADRSRRTGRQFALVLFDLDDLKILNDTHGHLCGTHAICRVGNTMRVYCRNIDTAVRYGGDEFALLLPETQETGANEVARRISLQVANDGGAPAISVSFGITTFPEGGESFEEVFGRADAALYKMKKHRKEQHPYRKVG